MSAFAASLDRNQEVPAADLGTSIRVTVRNQAPRNGTFQTPVWGVFHDGSFDVYDLGTGASTELERLAEDGNCGPLSTAFLAAGAGVAQGAIAGVLGPVEGPIAPGEGASMEFRLDPSDPSNRYFSYASMIIPSNDAFVSNADPMGHPIFDTMGNFVGADFTVAAAQARDAGTEVNDELPMNTAFFGQTTPDTGVDELGTITVHPGFLPMGMGGILDDPMFSAADFANTPGYEFLSFTFEELVPTLEPTGDASFQIDSGGTMLAVDITAVNLSGAVTAMHLHRAAQGVSGPVEIDLMGLITQNGGGLMKASGTVAISSVQIAGMRSGQIYLNVHTALNPGGEIRGQVAATEAFAADLDMAQEVPAPVVGTALRVVVQNQAPVQGTYQTPLWVGFHDGTFDTYDLGAPASAELERLAEDGNCAPLSTAFLATSATIDGAVTGTIGPIAPGETAAHIFRLDPTMMTHRYLSYVSMIIPSNDAFVANADPLAHEIFDGAGTFVANGFVVAASSARDAGTEVNDELPMNTAFFGQTTPDTGVFELANVTIHPGFLAPGMGGILDDPMFAAADFANTPGYEFLAVTLQEAATPLSAVGSATLRLDASGTMATIAVTAVNLSGPVTGMHLHRGATGVSGPVEIDLGGLITLNSNGVLKASGTVSVSADQVTALRSDEIYLNIHTALNPSGEIRGQMSN